MYKSVFFNSLLKIVMVFSFLFAGCSDSKDDGYVKVDGEERECSDLIGSIRMDGDVVMFRPYGLTRELFYVGDCEGLEVEIINWKSDYDDFKDGCIIKGKYRKVKYKPAPDGLGTTSYFLLSISEIAPYELPTDPAGESL